jgi:hypothetical protein
MATTSLKGKNKDAEKSAAPAATTAEAPAANADTQVAVRPDTQVARPFQQASDMVGAWDRTDERLPRINLIHKTSKDELVKKFGIGSFVFSKEVKLSDGETPFYVTALVVAKDYAQKLPWDSTETPAVFKTPEEVRSNGGTLDYSKEAVAEETYFQPRAHIQLITEMPESASGEEGEALFPYEFDGKTYGMAILTVSSSAYTSVGKELATLRDQNKVMRNGLRYGRLALTSEGRKNAKNSWVVPVIKYAGENPADLVAFFEGLM